MIVNSYVNLHRISFKYSRTTRKFCSCYEFLIKRESFCALIKLLLMSVLDQMPFSVSHASSIVRKHYYLLFLFVVLKFSQNCSSIVCKTQQKKRQNWQMSIS